MIVHSTQVRRPGLRLAAALLAVALPTAALPVPAMAAPTVTPASAKSARKPAQDRGKQLSGSDPGEAAAYLAGEAKKLGDPVLFIDAAEAYKQEGVAERDKAALQTAVEQASIGLDILHFQQDPRCDPQWQHLDSGEFDAEIGRAKQVIADSEKAMTEVDKPVEAPPPVEEPKKKERPRDGRGYIAAGSLLTVVGVGGLGMIGAGLALGAKAQKGVEGVNPADLDYDQQVDEWDGKGKTANIVAYAGIGVAAVGLAAGIALLAIGVKKRKQYRAENGPEEASVSFAPALGRGYAGFGLAGRF